MKNFLQLCTDTEQKLGRKLAESELEFLQWVFNRYKDEQQEKKCIS